MAFVLGMLVLDGADAVPGPHRAPTTMAAPSSTLTVERWNGRQAALRRDLDTQRRRNREAVAADDTDLRVVWAGTGVSRIHEASPAGEIVRTIAGPNAAPRPPPVLGRIVHPLLGR